MFGAVCGAGGADGTGGAAGAGGSTAARGGTAPTLCSAGDADRSATGGNTLGTGPPGMVPLGTVPPGTEPPLAGVSAAGRGAEPNSWTPPSRGWVGAGNRGDDVGPPMPLPRDGVGTLRLAAATGDGGCAGDTGEGGIVDNGRAGTTGAGAAGCRTVAGALAGSAGAGGAGVGCRGRSTGADVGCGYCHCPTLWSGCVTGGQAPWDVARDRSGARGVANGIGATPAWDVATGGTTRGITPVVAERADEPRAIPPEARGASDDPRASAKSSSIRPDSPMAITPPHTEQRARMPASGTFAGSTRNTVPHSGQPTFIAAPPRSTFAQKPGADSVVGSEDSWRRSTTNIEPGSVFA